MVALNGSPFQKLLQRIGRRTGSPAVKRIFTARASPLLKKHGDTQQVSLDVEDDKEDVITIVFELDDLVKRSTDKVAPIVLKRVPADHGTPRDSQIKTFYVNLADRLESYAQGRGIIPGADAYNKFHVNFVVPLERFGDGDTGHVHNSK